MKTRTAALIITLTFLCCFIGMIALGLHGLREGFPAVARTCFAAGLLLVVIAVHGVRDTMVTAVKRYDNVPHIGQPTG